MTTLQDRTAIITGGGSGIGRATAHALARRGARILVADIDPGAADTVAAEIADAGGTAAGVRMDVTADGAFEGLRDAALRTRSLPRTFGSEPGMRGPGEQFAFLDAAVVGEQVADAVLANTFMLYTHPEVRELLAARAADWDAFIEKQTVQAADPLSRGIAAR